MANRRSPPVPPTAFQNRQLGTGTTETVISSLAIAAPWLQGSPKLQDFPHVLCSCLAHSWPQKKEVKKTPKQ